MGAMMSRLGVFVAVIAMVVFCYRLILREEAELKASQATPTARRCRVCGPPRGRVFLPPDAKPGGGKELRQNLGTGDLRQRLSLMP
jgi:hypothetical protein